MIQRQHVIALIAGLFVLGGASGVLAAGPTHTEDSPTQMGTPTPAPDGTVTNASASVTFEGQTSNGSAVTVAQASNGSAPYYVAVWTLNNDSEPETLLGVQQANETDVSNVTVSLTENVTEDQTLVAAVHPDTDGDAATADPNTSAILASDTANVTVAEDVTATPTPTPAPNETPQAGVLTLGELDVPAQITAGEQINVTVPVENPTGAEVTGNVTLRVRGNAVETQQVTLAANETRNVTFQVNVSEDRNRLLLTAVTDADTETGLFEVGGTTAGTPNETPNETGEVETRAGELNVSALEAAQIAQNETDAKPVAVKLATDNGSLVYGVLMAHTNGSVTGVVVDAMEPTVIRTAPDLAMVNATVLSDVGGVENVSQLRSAVDAIQAAQEVAPAGAMPIEVAIEAQPGLLAQQVTFANPETNEPVRVVVDATDGAVLGVIGAQGPVEVAGNATGTATPATAQLGAPPLSSDRLYDFTFENPSQNDEFGETFEDDAYGDEVFQEDDEFDQGDDTGLFDFGGDEVADGEEEEEGVFGDDLFF